MDASVQVTGWCLSRGHSGGGECPGSLPYDAREGAGRALGVGDKSPDTNARFRAPEWRGLDKISLNARKINVIKTNVHSESCTN
jgi:hypothetical protein